ncbi:MAG: OmpA family protein [Desulfobacterales bacterium]|nr:OmpA family protein [Desulfobacterales bacterium]
MKVKSIQNILLLIAVSLLLSACAGKKAQESVQMDDGAGMTDDTIVSGTLDSDVMGMELAGPQGVDANDPLGKRVIYFDYNSATLTFEGESIAQAHGQYLADHPNVFITLEGHADERGTSEYNLALAEDRAKIVSQIMGVYGVALDRIQLVSYGEERPVALSSDEAAYALNRRVEIVYQ